MLGFDIQKVMKQAQKLQDEMGGLQKELEAMSFTGTAGGGAVTVVCNGKKEFSQVKISPEAAGDAAMLEDLVLAALNDVAQQVDRMTQEKMSGLTSGLNIPGLNLPNMF